MNRIQRWWQQRFLRKHRIPLHLWEHAVAQCPVLAPLGSEERVRLRELSSHFLRNKHLSGAQGLVVSDEMRVIIAAQACLLILQLELDDFGEWHEVIIYPDSFVANHEEFDEAGVLHTSRHALGGESWQQGPVILSWRDIRPGAQLHGPGSNVVLHEFAHKLDMGNGAANGMPPLHINMSRPAWTAALSAAFDDLRHQLSLHHHSAIDPYAAENPAEFFAVITEVFFEQPEQLHRVYPEVYAQLKQYYRQDPLDRLQKLHR